MCMSVQQFLCSKVVKKNFHLEIAKVCFLNARNHGDPSKGPLACYIAICRMVQVKHPSPLVQLASLTEQNKAILQFDLHIQL